MMAAIETPSHAALLPDIAAAPMPVVGSCHPMDSVRILRQVLELSRRGESITSTAEPGTLASLIAPGILRDLLSTLHFRDPRTLAHSRRVAKLATGLAGRFGWEESGLRELEVAALLHDVGKIGIPDHIMMKPGGLTPEETEMMSRHLDIGTNILQAARVNPRIIGHILQAGRLCQGAEEANTRYGRECPLAARLLALSDAYDSLTHPQTYRQQQTHEQAMSILKDGKRGQFDSTLTEAIDRWIKESRLGTKGQLEYVESASEFAPLSAGDLKTASDICNVFYYMYMLETLYDGCFLLDADLRILIWSRQARNLFADESIDFQGRTWTSQLFGWQHRDPERGNRSVHVAIESGQSSVEKLPVSIGERATELEIHAIPILSDERSVMGVGAFIRDCGRLDNCKNYIQLKRRASHDPLTGLANRGELENQLAVVMESWLTNGSTGKFAVIFADIDHFKSINDTYGHDVGDEVLIEFARLLQNETYSGEVVGRYGGEEFVILCPDTTLSQAEKRAERIRMAICGKHLSSARQLSVTSSFGVTEVEPGDSMASVLRRADTALYASKTRGRNRTTSLTNDQLLGGAKEERRSGERDQNPWELRRTFSAVVTSEMLMYKLAGFVEEEQAVITKVIPGCGVFRVGKTGWFSGWGKTPDRQPVDVTVELGNKIAGGSHRSTVPVEVKVTVNPVGSPGTPERFKARAISVVRMLQEYFAGSTPTD